MKIAILGTKGIPNNYGGYEQFAEYISVRLLARGHSVTVYNPTYHAFKGEDYNGVQIIRKFSPEKLMGGAANIIFDYLCLKDALNRDFDVIYEAGYHSVALSYKLLRVKSMAKPVIVTNMDGLEWKRSKWRKWVQTIIKKLEKIAVKESPHLISDNIGIQQYLLNKFKVKSFYIPYGADPVLEFDESHVTRYNVKEFEYFILVARLEPENNVETIIQAHVNSKTKFPLLVVGNHTTKHGKHLRNSFESSSVRFLGGIYGKPQLDSIRHFSAAYFHGHSVGGTNPSLLEAMASQCLIIAHKNPFNESILGNSAFYFENKSDATRLIDEIAYSTTLHRKQFTQDNLLKINSLYNWDTIVTQHEDLFSTLLAKSRLTKEID